MLSDQPHVDRMPDEFPATEDGFSSPLRVAGRQRVELARSAASACFGNNSRWTTLEFASNSRAIPGNVSPKSEEALEPSTFLFRNGAMEKFMRQVRLPIGLLLLGLLLPPAGSVAWAGQVAKTDLFAAGEGGYKLYRIPGIVVSAAGTVLAYCEARRGDSGDWGTIDVMLRRSTDGGKTWLPRQRLVHLEGDLPLNPVAAAQGLDRPGENTVNNPVAIVDYEDGSLHFLYCLESLFQPAQPFSSPGRGNRRPSSRPGEDGDQAELRRGPNLAGPPNFGRGFQRLQRSGGTARRQAVLFL